VVERTVKAVNYQYRSGQTRIDFAGTVLLPEAKGEALVESKTGRTQIDAKFSRVAAPTRFGREYLTYVLWAITPEGHPKNLGEIVGDSGDHAHLNVTTDLQSFGMIVTAEPYSAVRQPSDVVVMENVVRPDTMGSSEPIRAKVELLPRGSYTFTRSGPEIVTEGPKVSAARYESLVAIYQAQNAVQIARSQGADQYAADTFARAESQLADARRLEQQKGGRNAVVTAARQAAQTAEDARAIAVVKKQETELTEARSLVAKERERRETAERAARQAQAQPQAQTSEQPVETASLLPAAAKPAPDPSQIPVPPPPVREPETRKGEKSEVRVQLMQHMNVFFTTVDTPRGLMITLHDRDFRGAALDPAISARLANLAAMLAAHPELRVEVDGHGEQFSNERAAAVRDTMLRAGMLLRDVTSQGLGTSRPVAAPTSATGREQNRRVEIVVTGESIGTLAHWDRTYNVR
jgi:outer membrane protein OmpA-like peptidoglycan-associated protein